MLRIAGYRDDALDRSSDALCTALQLTNFWQDVRRDILERDRIYLPRESMERLGVIYASLGVPASSGNRIAASVRFAHSPQENP